MALDYTAVFTDIGLLIKKLNSYLSVASSTYPTDRDALAVEMDTFLACTSKLKGPYDAAQRAIVSLRNSLAAIVTTRLQDNTTVLSQLSLISSDVTGILRALYRDMGLSSQSIDASTVTLGSMSYAAANVGTGKAYSSKVLDGVTAPGANMPANQLYNGVDSELCVPSETITLECVADSEVDHRTEGEESFSIRGGVAPSLGKLSWETDGSGQGPTITTANRSTIITNKDFENWSGSTPQGWTLASGTVTEETSTVFRGSSALKFAGTGAAVLSMNQAVSPARLTARKRYLLSIAVKASGVPAAGALTVKFTGTGYTAASSEKITIAAGSMPTSWTLYQCWINLPTAIPSDWALDIGVAGPLSNGTNLFLDSIAFSEAVYHGGLCLGVVAGSTNWLRGDRITFTVANDQAGVFQEFFRKFYGFQLVSNNAAGETISDGLAS